MIKKIKSLSPEAAYKVNVGIYLFHVIVAIVTFFYMKFTPNIIGKVASWKEALSWLWSFYSIEFYFYCLMLALIWKRVKFVKYLLIPNMVGILIFIFVGTFFGYSMALSYFVILWIELLKITEMWSPVYFILMGAIWLFYLINTIFWVKKIEWKN